MQCNVGGPEMTDKVVYLAFENPKAPVEMSVHACSVCRNKTFVLAASATGFPALRCAACSRHISYVGFADSANDGESA